MEKQLQKTVMLMGNGPRVTATMPADLAQHVARTLIELHNTAVLFAYHDRLGLITCRHVVEGGPGMRQYKAFTKVRAAGSVVPYVIPLDDTQLQYHPDDTAAQTYDLAIFPVGPRQGAQIPFPYLELTNAHLPQPHPGMAVKLIGFPTYALNPAVIRTPTPLQPHVIKGSIVAPFSVTPSNFNKEVIGQFAVEIAERHAELEGMSGGLVIAEDAGKWHPMGMMTSIGNGHLGPPGGQARQITFAVFMPLIRLIESLDGLDW